VAFRSRQRRSAEPGSPLQNGKPGPESRRLLHHVSVSGDATGDGKRSTGCQRSDGPGRVSLRPGLTYLPAAVGTPGTAHRVELPNTVSTPTPFQRHRIMLSSLSSTELLWLFLGAMGI